MSTFRGVLEKNGYVIRIWHEDNGAYLMEYSNDGFETKAVKVYGSRCAFLKAMEHRFAPDELKNYVS